ncbi:major facilitator superfamily domain-containing protein [Zychaea mexicana]|uniref:major facilitator superfamily domain-containing protein n=1 Tax=Zychaea mexicana TaxID=64656 RepID=UPI0022FE492A|nr:major facilitator superfamily domain-containing protein [Zychaea mexicana]KAI9488748.1 major facilitator superfamily domain-containing protein [Zychaea mexicana]
MEESNINDGGQPKKQELPTDGKQAWTVGIGSFLISLLCGLPNCWGIMQDHYKRSSTFASDTDVNIKLTFVGALFQAMVLSCVFFINLIYSRVGFRPVLYTGLILTTAGLMLASLATSIWQLYLSVSVCTGLGIACFSTVGLRILPQWFVKYRATAFGVQASTFAIFALIVPHIMVAINNALGAPWTYRVLGFISFALILSSVVLIRERVQSPPVSVKKQFVSLVPILKDLNMMIWVVVGPIQMYASYTVFVFIPSYATFIGLTETQGAATISALSAAGIVGRIAAGICGDKLGHLNTYIMCMIICTISIFAIWMFANNFGVLLLFAVVNGLVYGSYFTLAAPVAISILGSMEKYPAALSINMLAFIFFVLGPLIASVVEANDTQHPFLYCKIIAGVGYAACALLSLFLKFRLKRNFLANI